MPKLLYRSQAKVGECPISYLIRLAEHNGIKHIGHLLHLGGLAWKNRRIPVQNILNGEHDIRPYLSNLGINSERLSSTLTHTKQLFQLSHGKGGNTPPFHSRPRVCPDCLLEGEYARLEWLLQPVVACTRHKTMLIDIDPTTGTQLSWYRANLRKFQNGKDIDKVKRIPAPTNAIDMSGHFHRLSRQISESKAIPTKFKDMDYIEYLEALELIAHYLYRLSENDRFKPASLNNITLATTLEESWITLNDWPKSFYVLLDSYKDAPMSKRGSTGIRKYYRDLYDNLFRRKTHHGIEPIKLEFERYITLNLEAPYHCTRLLINEGNIIHINKIKASKIIGCRPESLNKFIHCGDIEEIVVAGKKTYIKDQIINFSKIREYNWSFKEAMAQLCISRHQLLLLLRGNILKTIRTPTNTQRDWLIDKKHCSNLISTLIGKSNYKIKGKTQASIQRHGYDINRLILAMINKEITYTHTPDTDYPNSIKAFSNFIIK